MSESVIKKSVVNSSNKSKKSKTDILRAALLNYLKQRNYVANEDERLRKPELTQSPIEMACNTLVQNEVSRSNSFLYSNVFCLNNNSTQVDQQFSRLLSFVQSQIEPIRDELQNILPALLCHLYIEMLKGRDSRPAFEFLKKNAPLVANIDSLSTPLPYKINGTAFNLLNDESAPMANGSNSQNSFSRDSEEISEAGNTFKELIQIISTMTRIKDIETHGIVVRFRTSKYELRLSQKSMFALKRYLAKNGHVLIIQALHVWFHIEIFNEEGLTTESSSIFETLLEDCGLENPCGKKMCSGKLKKVVNMGCPNCYDDIQKTLSIKKEDLKSQTRYRTKITLPMPSRYFENPTKSELLQYSLHQMKPYSFPFKVYNVINTDDKLTSADLDPSGCHIAAGFEDSLITLYSVKRNIYYGRKPYETFRDRMCLWNTGNCTRSDDSSSSSSDDETSSVNQFPISKRQISKKERWRSFMEKRCTENVFSKAGGVALRGHSKAVTDVLFSKHNPLLLSVSRDQTIRVWKASDYTCAAVYRGHNYPIWCIAESPTGLYMATGSKDLTARLWSTDREFPLQTYVGHTQDVDSVAFHPNGSYLASGSTDQTVRLWCVTTGKLLRVFTECRLPVFCVSFSPDGKYLAAAGEESRVRIFDLAAGSQLAELKDIQPPVIGITWTPDSRKIMACSMKGAVKVWDIQNIGKKKTVLPTVIGSATNATVPVPITDSQVPSTSTKIPEPSLVSNTSNIQLLKSYETRCQRLIKMQYNSDNSMTFIGNN